MLGGEARRLKRLLGTHAELHVVEDDLDGGLILLVAALGWWKTGDRRLLATHYGFSLVGVTFEAYFTYLQVFVIDAICVWCASYGISLVLRFLIALVVWTRRDRMGTPAAGW